MIPYLKLRETEFPRFLWGKGLKSRIGEFTYNRLVPLLIE